MIDAAAIRAALPQLVLAAIPALLALRFGGYHPRHAGWVVLALAAWACVEAVRGRLSSPRSPAGVATIAMVALVTWSAASIAWADVSRHDAWVEAMRAAGYAAMFVLGVALLAGARAYARYTWMVGASIAALSLVVAGRLATSDAPLRAFVAGRLDWPVGYAPGMAGLCLFGVFVLLGVSCAAQQRHSVRGATIDLLASGAALGGAGACAAVALLAQSRGTVPALAVGVVVSLVATPNRVAWLLRAGALVVVVAAAWGQLGRPFRAAFDLRQAPFTEGADQQALLATAEGAASAAGHAVVLAALVLGVVGAALVPASAWLAERVDLAQERLGFGLALPATILVVAVGGTLVLVGGSGDGSPRGWAAAQWSGCVDPPDIANDPGSSSSYFANAGTGRCDYYRVAIGAARSHPLTGLGAGNFRGEYVRERETREEPRVVHSLPLQLLAELGIVGLAIGSVVLGCVVLAASRFVRSGSTRDATFAGAIGALGYWVAHASIDWLWQLPAVTLPAMALAGGLLACVSRPQGAVPRAAASVLAAAFALATIALVLPVAMADARLRTARDSAIREDDPVRALQAALDAQRFDPTWAEPVITEGALRAAAGQREGAADAGRRAIELEPDNWSVLLRASGLIGLDDTQEGLAAFQRARELNPQLPATIDRGEVERRESTSPDSVQNPDG